jgi:hypothetical protein
MKTLLWIGTAADALMALLLVVVFGFVLDSWHDAREPWAGPVVTAFWTLSFAACAGAPWLAFRLRRRGAKPARVVLTVWLPPLVLIGATTIGFLIAPP